ncbi:MAG: hypothetical protein QM725_16540 [Lacibacter sp.]
MKRLFTILIFFVAATGFSFAQEQQPEPNQEKKIQALEIAFISRKLDLTPDEAQKFWPVYNEYRKEMKQAMISQRNDPNKDAVMNEQKLLDIKKKYRDRFIGVIGQPRMNKLFEAEREFRAVLLNQLKNRPDRPALQRKLRN